MVSVSISNGSEHECTACGQKTTILLYMGRARPGKHSKIVDLPLCETCLFMLTAQLSGAVSKYLNEKVSETAGEDKEADE